jgi:hypothetical protein
VSRTRRERYRPEPQPKAAQTKDLPRVVACKCGGRAVAFGARASGHGDRQVRIAKYQCRACGREWEQ